MKKIIYISIENPDKNLGGVEYKIYNQILEFKKQDFYVEHLCYDINRKGVNKLSSNLNFMNKKFNKLFLEKCMTSDFIYLRYFLSDFNLLYLLKKVRVLNKNVKIIAEIPTYPYDNEFPNTSISLILDKINRKKLYKYIDRIVTFSDDKEIFGIKAIRISNGIDSKNIKERIPQNQDNKINIIGVAQLNFWHGYDRIITGLSKYYLNGGNRDINVHIVGYGKNKVIEQYKQMILKYNLETRIFLHGKKTGDELDEIYNKCELAFDSLGRHRSNVKYNSSLKGKEYLAKGLPIISGVKTELDDDKDFKYYLRIPADDTPVNFNKIIEFYNEIYNNNDVLEININIRKFCENKFEFSRTFSTVIEEIKRM